MSFQSLLLFSVSLFLDHVLDDANGDDFVVVTDHDSTQGRVLRERLHNYWSRRSNFDHGRISSLDGFWVLLKDLASLLVNLAHDLLEHTPGMNGVALDDGRVTLLHLARIMRNNHLRYKIVSFLARAVLWVANDLASFEISPQPHREVADFECDAVARASFVNVFVPHMKSWYFTGFQSHRLQDDWLAFFDHASGDSPDGNKAHTVTQDNIRERHPQRLLQEPLGSFDVAHGVKKVRTRVPRHVRRLLCKVVSFKPSDRNEWHTIDFEANLLKVRLQFVSHLIEPFLFELNRVHLVDAADELLAAHNVCNERVLFRLTFARHTISELLWHSANHEHGHVSLGHSAHHVHAKVTFAGCIVDSYGTFFCLKVLRVHIHGMSQLSLM